MANETLAPWAELIPSAGSMTVDQLLALPEDGWQYELVAGRLVRMTPVGLEHGEIWLRLFRALDRFVEAQQLGMVTPPDVGFRISGADDAETVLSPDIGFISAAHMSQLPAMGTPERKKYLPLAPDLAVEIASPDQYHPEMASKARLYIEAGTRLIWIIWPAARQVDIWRSVGDQPTETLNSGENLIGQDVLPGFTYPVANLFM